MNRHESKEIAIDTFDCINRKCYKLDGEYVSLAHDIKVMEERTKLYREEPLFITRDLNHNRAIIEFSGMTSLEAAKALYDEYHDGGYKIGVLNFASATRPGGGFLNGAMAQEESLARASTLYSSLLKETEFYQHNIKNNNLRYTDYMIFSENVTFFKNDYGETIDPFNVDVITSPAPNKAALILRNPSLKEDLDFNDEMYEILENRIQKILKVAVLNNVDCLVLGAFGCGVFGNNMDEVASIYNRLLVDMDYQYYFKHIIFAVYDKDPSKYKEFEEAFYY